MCVCMRLVCRGGVGRLVGGGDGLGEGDEPARAVRFGGARGGEVEVWLGCVKPYAILSFVNS